MLTWATVLAAAASALWLAYHGTVQAPDTVPGGLPVTIALPTEPTAAGPAPGAAPAQDTPSAAAGAHAPASASGPVR